MTVTITPRAYLQRRDTYTGVTRVVSNGVWLVLQCTANPAILIDQSTVAAITLDEEGGAIE